jgi:hypothetical protein
MITSGSHMLYTGGHLGTPVAPVQQTSTSSGGSEDVKKRTQEVAAENLSVSLDKFSSDLFRLIVSYPNVEDLGDCSRQWKALASGDSLREKIIARAFAFGKEKWAQYFGDIGVEPPLPPDIEEILQSPCPYFEGRTVAQTHMLVLIPETINGKPLNLKNLIELIKEPKDGNKTCFQPIWEKILKEHGDTPITKSRWVLMTKEVIPGSLNKSFAEQQELIAKNSNYSVPTLVEAAVCILMHYVQTGKRLYCDDPYTFTRCQESVEDDEEIWQVIVGGFLRSGLGVNYYRYVSRNVGVGGLRKFF